MTVTVRMYRGIDLRDGCESLFAVDQGENICANFYSSDSNWLTPESFGHFQNWSPIPPEYIGDIDRESLKHMICIWEHDYDD